MNEDWNKELIVHRGVSRDERVLRALLPENIRIDGRNLQEWLAFTARAARLIRYFNQHNEPSGNWAPFLEKDPAVFLALLMDNRPGDWDVEARNILRRFNAAWGVAHKEKACRDLIKLVADMARLLDAWYRGSESLLTSGNESPLALVLNKAIQSELSDELRKFWGILLSLRPSVLPEDPDVLFSGFHPVWNVQFPPQPFPLKVDDLGAGVEEIRRVFQRLHFTMAFLSEKAPEWFRESLEEKDDHDPHTGLLLAFLQLFGHARDQINTYTGRHLHHYYFDLLQQRQKAHVPDRTVVCFQLADHIEAFTVEKRTHLLAGVNDAGLESHYATTEPLMLTQVRVAALKTLHVSKSDMMKVGSSYRLVSDIYAAPVANSNDGLGMPFSADDPSWPVFGEDQLDKNRSDRRMTDADIGFVVAAPVLALSEGTREIDLQFRFTDASFALLIDLLDDIIHNAEKTKTKTDTPHELRKKRAALAPKLFAKAFRVSASGAGGWFQINRWQIDSPDAWVQNNAVTMTLSLLADDPAIVANIPETLGESFDTPWPLVKIQMNSEGHIYAYSFVQFLELETLRIETRVKGLKSLSLYNELGPLDLAAPFFPFGPLPKRNAYLMVGHKELFCKKLTGLTINVEWNNLPDIKGGFGAYYREYNNGTDNDSFEVRLSALSNYTFRPANEARQQSFPLFAAAAPDGVLQTHISFEDIQLDRFQIQPDYALHELPEYSNRIRSGYFKLQLSNPPAAFGHADYPRLFSKYMIAQAKSGGIFGRAGENQADAEPPREPFTPVINKITLGYKAGATLNLRPFEAGENDEAAREKIICLHPFGQQTIFAEGKATDRYLWPQYEYDGYLYIGLAAVKPGQALSLFFQLRESKQKTWSGHPEVHWSYLHTNRWEPLTQERLLADGTRQFTTTGIIKILAPSDISTGNTVLPPDLFWLRAAAKDNTSVAGRVLGVYLNAVEVVWIDNGDAAHFDPQTKLPPIRELVQQRPEIAGLIQPLGFYGGSPGEQLTEFYLRVSERMRHKNRAITLWDVERLVLGHFPELRKVKCIGRMEYETLLPGDDADLLVAVIPKSPENDLEPMLGFHQLEVIREFLNTKTSPFVQIRVINPVYEKVIVSCSILLQPGLEREKGAYRQLLQDDLLHFICPWLRGGLLEFGGRLSKNSVLAFIKSRPYVRFVTRFSLVRIFEPSDAYFEVTDTAQSSAVSETLTARTPWSVFSPVAEHNISFITDEKHLLPEAAAIEAMRLGTDFIVLLGETDDTAPSEGLKQYPGERLDDEGESWLLVPKS